MGGIDTIQAKSARDAGRASATFGAGSRAPTLPGHTSTRRLDARGLFPDDQKQKTAFDPEGSGFDINTAIDAGLRRDPTPGPNQFHLQTRLPLDAAAKRKFGFSDDQEVGMILKGKGHRSFKVGVEDDARLGFTLVKRRGRYFTVK